MFYCDACMRKNEWPAGFSKSAGPCEVCDKWAVCNDTPSGWLSVGKRKSESKKD